MSVTNLTHTLTNGTRVVSTALSSTVALPISASDEQITFITGGSLTAVSGAKWTFTRCIVFSNNIGYATTVASGGEGELIDSQMITLATARRDQQFSKLENSRYIEAGGLKAGAIYTRPNAVLKNAVLDGCGWWEIAGVPSVVFNFTCQNMSYGFLNWNAGRIDLFGFSAINMSTADGWINSNQIVYLWNKGTFDRTKLNMGAGYNYFEGVTASWEFQEKLTAAKQSGALLIYRESYDGGAQTERARYTTDANGRLTGTYDSRTRVTGANQSRPTLYLLQYRAKAGSTYPSRGGGLTFSIAAYVPAIEVRAYGMLPPAGFGPANTFAPSAQVGALLFDQSVGTYEPFRFDADTRITATEAVAAAITGLTHGLTSVSVAAVSRTLDQIYDSRAKYWRDTDGVTYASGVGDEFGANWSLTIGSGAAVTTGTKLKTLTTPGSITVASGGALSVPLTGVSFLNYADPADLPTSAALTSSAQGLRITAPGTYDLSLWTFSGNTADVTVANSTGAVTIKTGGVTLTVDQGSGNTVTIDETVPFVLNFPITGGTMAAQNLGKFLDFKGVFASHVAAQAAINSPVLADYYAVDGDSNGVREQHGYWNGSAWVVHASSIITEHEILAASNGGAGVGATQTLNLLQGQTWRIYADKVGYYPNMVEITVPTGGGSKDLPLTENPSTIGLTGGEYSAAAALVSQASLLPADSSSVMTLLMPSMTGQTANVHYAFVELMRSSLENARGALASSNAFCVEVDNYIVRLRDDTLRVKPLAAHPPGTRSMFEVPVVLENYTIDVNPVDANGNYICISTFPRQVVIGGTVLGRVAVATEDKSEIKNHVTAMNAAFS